MPPSNANKSFCAQILLPYKSLYVNFFHLRSAIGMKSRVVSLIPFLLVNDLLLLNRYPDVEADKEA